MEDGDGDTATATASLNNVVKFEDDGPANFSPSHGYVLMSATSSVSAGLNFAAGAGADGVGGATFTVTNGTPATDANGNLLTSGGDQIYLYGEGTSTLIGTTDPLGLDASKQVFTVELNASGDSYTFTVLQPFSNGTEITDINFAGAKAGNNDVVGVGSNDPLNKLDFLLTGNTSINTNADTIGAGSGQRFDDGETVRIDFVTNLTDDGANPRTFFIDDYETVTTFRQQIAVVNPSAPGTAALTVTALVTDGDLDLYGDPDDVSTPITAVRILTKNDLTGEYTDITASFTGTVAIIGGVAYITGLQEGQYFEITTSTGFNAVEITGGNESPFKLGIFDVTTTNDSEPIPLEYDIVATDGDGDPVSSTIDIDVLPDNGDNFVGTSTGETLTGNANANILAGLEGDDILSGGDGDDVLIGGAGNDDLTGGLGADTFVFQETGAANLDEILDYSDAQGDTIDLTALLNGAYAPADVDDHVLITQTGSDVTIQVDVDGAGAGPAQEVVVLKNYTLGSGVTVIVGADDEFTTTNGTDFT